MLNPDDIMMDPYIITQIQEHTSSYTTYPSMTKHDITCKRRVSKKAICNALVGNVLAKLAFFDQVHYDPTTNQLKFPENPNTIVWVER